MLTEKATIKEIRKDEVVDECQTQSKDNQDKLMIIQAAKDSL